MRRPEEAKRVLHIGIVRASAAFGYNPVDVLGRILDVARLAMNTILGIDLEAWRTFLQTDHFVDPCRTIALGGLIIKRQIVLYRDGGVLELEMNRLILLEVGVCEENLS